MNLAEPISSLIHCGCPFYDILAAIYHSSLHATYIYKSKLEIMQLLYSAQKVLAEVDPALLEQK